jgi:hypothetical protein
VLLLALSAAMAADAEYRSASIGKDGRLHILAANGQEEVVRKFKGQTSFGTPTISEDRRTVAWSAVYPDPTILYYKGAELSFYLVLYRNRSIRHRLGTDDQMLWDWSFRQGGKSVGYCIGPTHGGATQCVLRDVDSGKIVATWDPKSNTDPPDWAEKLRY